MPLGDVTETRVEQTGPPGREFTYVDIGSIDRDTKRIVDPKVLPSSKAPSRATTGFTPPKNDASPFGGGIPFFKPSDLDVGYNVREFRDSLTEAGAEHGRVLPPLSILVTCIGATSL